MSSAAAATKSSSSGVAGGHGNGDGYAESYGDGHGEAHSLIQFPRRPSTRPLDHRWDRSRGIVFSGFNQRRAYASKPISRSLPASTPAAAPARNAAPSSAASAVESGYRGSFGASSGYSHRQGKDLEKKVRELGDETSSLKARNKELKAKLELQESQTASFKKSARDLENKLDTAELNHKRKQSEQEARHRTDLERQLARQYERIGPDIEGNKALRDEIRETARAPLLNDIKRLKETCKEMEADQQRQVRDLRAAMENAQEQHETALRNETARTRDVNIALDKASKELQGVKARKQVDREDYTQYHSIFAKLMNGIFCVREEVNFARRRIDEEVKYWRNSKRRFRTSENLRLFLHSSKYASIKEAIAEFLDERETQAKTTLDGLAQIELRLMQSRVDMQFDAHQSRSLTRHHQLDDHQSAYNSAYLAQHLATSVPFQDLHKAYTNDIKDLKDLIQASPSNSDVEDLKTQLQGLLDDRKKVGRFLTFFDYVREWQALKALRDDDMVEKAVWVNTIKAKQALDAAVDRFHEYVEDHPTQNAEEWRLRGDLYKEVRLQRVEFDNLVAHVRQRHLLANDLGKMSEKETTQVEETIKRETDLARLAVDGALAGLLGIQKPARRHRTPIPKSSEPNAGAAATSAATGPLTKPPLGISDLQITLQAELANKQNKLQIATSGDKKTAASRITPQKATVGRTKRPHAGARTIRPRSSSEKPKTKPRSAMSKDAEVKRTVGGTGTVGLKPTESRQAAYRSPPYDTKSSASISQKRASRSGNMGFRMLNDALTPPPAREEESADPGSTNMATHDASPAEDSASACDKSSSDEPSAPEDTDDAIPEEPQTVLSYHIPPKDYRDAVMASPNSNAAYWSHTLYKNADNQKPTVYYCQSYEQTEAKAKLFLNEPVVGFDLEWEFAASLKSNSPDIKRNVSLIQIAAEDKIGLFQLARFRTAKTKEEHMPPSLRKLLESPKIIKAGVNVSGDSSRLHKCLDVDMKGVFELSHMFRVVKQSEKVKVNFTLVKLSTQVQDVLLLPLKKDDVRISAWSKELNTQQTTYAAADAYAGFQLFQKLDNARKLMVPKPPRPAFYETFSPIVLGDGRVVSRSSDAGAKRKVVGKAVEVVKDEEEDEEEFFDAIEAFDPDPYGLGKLGEPEISGSIPNPPDEEFAPSGSGSRKQEIAYPVLPSQESETESSSSQSIRPAPSRTTTLPLRSKPTPNPLASRQAPPSAFPETFTPSGPSLEEESLQAKVSAPQSRPGPLPCPENQAAETWMITYRASHPTTPVGTPTLRAYHLWHHQRFELKAIAGFCRDPPLAMTTVASYIMQALKEAELPFDEGRVKRVLGVLPQSVHGKYRFLRGGSGGSGV